MAPGATSVLLLGLIRTWCFGPWTSSRVTFGPTPKNENENEYFYNATPLGNQIQPVAKQLSQLVYNASRAPGRFVAPRAVMDATVMAERGWFVCLLAACLVSKAA